MAKIRIGNAPCSWGALEFDLDGKAAGYTQVLDELAGTGYVGTELGDWGFMPTDPDYLAEELSRRDLTMLGAFVPVSLKDSAAHAPGVEAALKVARLLRATADRTTGYDATAWRPFLVLADNNGTDPVRTKNAGRITPEMGLSDEQWRTFAAGAEKVARAVRDETGMRTVFHHHCGGYVETPDEIARLMDLTDPGLLGLVFDTGHFAFGAGGCEGVMDGLNRLTDRIWYIHFKDCQPEVAARSRSEGWDYFQSVGNGVFCELGQGCVDFQAVKMWLDLRPDIEWGIVEQDVLPGMGAPKASAARNRAYLNSIGL